jgi:hypothetical protein
LKFPALKGRQINLDLSPLRGWRVWDRNSGGYTTG